MVTIVSATESVICAANSKPAALPTSQATGSAKRTTLPERGLRSPASRAIGKLLPARLRGPAEKDSEGTPLVSSGVDAGVAREGLLDGGEQLDRRGALWQIAWRVRKTNPMLSIFPRSCAQASMPLAGRLRMDSVLAVPRLIATVDRPPIPTIYLVRRISRGGFDDCARRFDQH